MQDLLAIIYVSAAIEPSDEKVESILLDSRLYNLEHGITGVLFYSKEAFLQYLEGSPDEVWAVYLRIKRARAHTNIRLLLNTDISHRVFSDWQMAYAQTTKSKLLTLSTADWTSSQQTLTNQASVSPGVSLLQTFWLASVA